MRWFSLSGFPDAQSCEYVRYEVRRETVTIRLAMRMLHATSDAEEGVANQP